MTANFFASGYIFQLVNQSFKKLSTAWNIFSIEPSREMVNESLNKLLQIRNMIVHLWDDNQILDV